ncbi:MAG TPA: MOSC domain-containing protein [Gaiellaceae bacterium]|nr:MOSC domain-containing protein [Gaiellaceae bacterium]
MPTYDDELRDCLGVVLGSVPPEPEFEAVAFFKQWLAETNLGLVPIADPATFSWPGEWLARVSTSDGDHAVVMYGSPSGPMVDPAGALAGGGTIEEGWLVAPLDLHVSIEQPWGSAGGTGVVAGLLVAPDAEALLHRVDTAQAIAGHGLEGDRYAEGRGTFSGRGRGYELTLVEAEALEDVELSWEDARRNIVTRGIELNALVGRRFTIGSVECIGRRLAEPCSHLEKLTRPGIMRPLVHRAGLRADILVGGTISVGDAVTASD